MTEQILRREGENILNEAGEVVARFEANNIIGDFGGSTSYSTEEQEVGTWIDGKPIYGKMIDVGTNYKINNSEVNLFNIPELNTLNIKQYVEAYFYITSETGSDTALSLPISAFISNVTGEHSYTSFAPWNNNANRHVMLYIKYTKTTD